jgi:hypothetical protein
MKVSDLEHIFQEQIRINGNSEFVYMTLIDKGYKVSFKHPVDDLESLLPMLDCFLYDGYEYDIPRFVK